MAELLAESRVSAILRTMTEKGMADEAIALDQHMLAMRQSITSLGRVVDAHEEAAVDRGWPFEQ